MRGDGYPRLVGDVGGTNVRLALVAAPGAPVGAVRTLAADAYPSLEAAIRDYLGSQPGVSPRQAAIGVATPVTGDEVRLTNRDAWRFSIGALERGLGLDRLLVLNDFTALALALPALPPADLVEVGGGAGAEGAPLALIGPGTGLGVSGLVPAGARWVPLAGEGGHVTLAAGDEREAAAIAALRRRFGHVSAERVLSGPGLANLHAALAEVDGVAAPPLDAAAIVAGALAGEPRALATVNGFLALLGSVAGDLALTLGARGGVYVGGGIVPRLLPLVAASPLRARFEAKGRFAEYLRPVPLRIIRAAESPALLGAARALDEP